MNQLLHPLICIAVFDLAILGCVLLGANILIWHRVWACHDQVFSRGVRE